MRCIFFTLLTILLTACGGGGGGGGTTATSSSNSSTSAYTYIKNVDRPDAYTPDFNSAGFMHRLCPSDNNTYITRAVTDFFETLKSNTNSEELKIKDWTWSESCGGSASSNNLTMTVPDNLGQATEANAPGTLSGHIAALIRPGQFLHSNHSILDPVNNNYSTQTVYIEYIYGAVSNSFSLTDYVDIQVRVRDYGTYCYYNANQLCLLATYWDNNLVESDDIAITHGDFTEVADMLTSSSSNYRVKALGSTVINDVADKEAALMGGSTYWGKDGCSLAIGDSASSAAGCKPFTVQSSSSEHQLSVDFAAETVKGTITLDNSFLLDNALSSLPPLGTFTIDATISGNSFSGTVTASTQINGFTTVPYQSSVKGNFYGPSSKEIGGSVFFWGTHSGGTASELITFAFAGSK